MTKIIVRNSEIERFENSDTGCVMFRFEIHNISDRPVSGIHSLYIYTGSDWSVFYDEKQCKYTNSDIEPYLIRHIIKTDFTVIPANDWLPIDIMMKKILYVDWEQFPRKDIYPVKGILRVDVNTETKSYKKEEVINTIIALDKVPF